MKDNNSHTPSGSGNSNSTLPLYEFFIALRQNNFLVTPGQIADCNYIISNYAGQIKNEQELCNYLAPVFANSPEEQLQFKEIFDGFFYEAPAAPPPPPVCKICRHIKKHWWKYITVVLVAIAIFLYPATPIINPDPTINLSLIQQDTVPTTAQKNSVTYKAQVRMDNISPDSAKHIILEPLFDWGDETSRDSTGQHSYLSEGMFTVNVYTKIYYRKKFLYNDSSSATASICFNPGSISLQKSFAGDSVKIGDTIAITAIVTGKKGGQIHWVNNTSNDTFNLAADKLTTSFDKEGPQSITASITYDSLNSPCNTQNSLDFFVYDGRPKPIVVFKAAANSNNIAALYKIKSYWFLVTAALCLWALLLTLYCARKWSNAQKTKTNAGAKQSHQDLVNSLSGTEGSAQIPFAGKNYLPLPEQDFNDISKLMRKRISDDAVFLDADRTIKKAINNAGFFSPQYGSRTQQCEYLVLIDENSNNSQQVKLFDYLAELLSKQNVFIQKYYYRKEPWLCYGIGEPNNISLEKLSEKYPKHILLIFGNAYQLIYQEYPVIDNSYMHLLNRWQYKAILTPVSFVDWGNKENNVLQEELPVLPVDIPGQLLLMQKLFGEATNVFAELKLRRNSFYDAVSVDFEDIDELYEYCENADWARETTQGSYGNLLFQWIAALAVYPTIRWELTLAIGKAILDEHDKTQELNFTNLLRIARIKWMRDGKFPEYTRLNLLKWLTRENEILARETILAAFNEIPEATVNRNHFAYEELQVQRLTNEFILFAHDPVKYKAYEKSKGLYEQLHLSGQVTDMPAKAYLENPGTQWETPLNMPGGSNAAGNISLEQYLAADGIIETPGTKAYLWATGICAILFVTFLAAFVALFIVNRSGKSVPVFNRKTSFTQAIAFNYQDTASVNYGKDAGLIKAMDLVIGIDSVQKKLGINRSDTITVNIDDVPENISISSNGINLFDSTFTLEKDSYDIQIIAPGSQIPPPDSPAAAGTAKLILSQKCASQSDNYSKLINAVNNRIQVTVSVEAGNTNANNTCINEMNYGNSVDSVEVTAIIDAFKKQGVSLTVNRKSAYPVSDYEMILYNSASTVETPTPVLYIQVSDNSLLTSANQFRSELVKMGINAQPVSIKNYQYNSEISYYDPAMQNTANVVKQYYSRYYPALKVQATLRKTGNAQKNKNVIAVWIKKLEPVIPPVADPYKIQNAKVTPAAREGEPFGIAFEIVSSNASQNLSNSNQQQMQQQQVPNLSMGYICIDGGNCTEFSFSPGRNITPVSKQLDLSSIKPGRHSINVAIQQLGIKQVIGSFTLSASTPVAPGCDTIRSSVTAIDPKAQKSYNNNTLTALEQNGIQITLESVHTGYVVISIQKENCAAQKISAYQGKPQTQKFCDGSSFSFILKSLVDNKRSALGKDATFELVLCKTTAERNSKAAY